MGLLVRPPNPRALEGLGFSGPGQLAPPQPTLPENCRGRETTRGILQGRGCSFQARLGAKEGKEGGTQPGQGRPPGSPGGQEASGAHIPRRGWRAPRARLWASSLAQTTAGPSPQQEWGQQLPGGQPAQAGAPCPEDAPGSWDPQPPPQGPGTRPGQEPPGHAGTGSGKGDAARNGLQPSCVARMLTSTGLASRGVHGFTHTHTHTLQQTHRYTPQHRYTQTQRHTHTQHLAHRCTHRAGQQLRAHTGIREALILTPALSVTC